MKRNDKERLPIFKERLRELQGTMSNTEFAELLGMSRQTIGFYLNGNRIPDALGLLQIASRCQVSADWLIGISDFRLSENNDQTVGTVGLSEPFVSWTKALKYDRPTELKALNFVLDSGSFQRAIDCIFTTSVAGCGQDVSFSPSVVFSKEWLDACANIHKMTNGAHCVSKSKHVVNGLLFEAQQEFNIVAKETAEYLHRLWAEGGLEELIESATRALQES